MARFGSRTLLAILAAMAMLLGVLAVVQYRWSKRVAGADAQREREHLETAASLFASEFNREAGGASEFLQNEAWAALQANKPLGRLPKLISELYYLDLSVNGDGKARRLGGDGLFAEAKLPSWAAVPHCVSIAIETPPALVTPVFDVATQERTQRGDFQVVRTLGGHPDRCFIARLDETYLRGTLFPRLIQQSFGETVSADYDFAVTTSNQPQQVLFGERLQPDLRRLFFSIMPADLALSSARAAVPSQPGHTAIVVQRVESSVITDGPAHLASVFGPGAWELQIARKGVPLAEAFERTQRRNLMASLAVETLLFATIAFLVVGARRMQRLAEHKMQFVAGVSHELRTPVSAIAMLSRNQADGLVTGDRVKQYGELMQQQSRRLNEMVEQTLQYAGMHSGVKRPERNEIDLRALIEEIVAARSAELALDGFAVEMAIDPALPKVLGDAQTLRTAIENLLSNAQKYGGAARWIRVTAAYSAAENEARVSVEDRGAGIDPADQSEIFEPFCRGRAAAEAQIPGSGLGLSLVRSAAEAHRGSVTFVSAPGRGSTFTLHLPA
jgi:two-component system sensor histidine kinase SenX3